MTKLRHIKLFESFVNEELNQGTKLSQALLLHQSKKPIEKGPEMDQWSKDNEIYSKSLKDYLRQYDIDVTIHPGFDDNLYLYMNFPESFMSDVKRFFGFGKSKIRLSYNVHNITQVTDFHSSSENLEEEISLSIGVDRTNTPTSHYASNEPNDYKVVTDISKVDPKAKQQQYIDLDKEDAQMMCKILQDINPYTKFKTPQILVDALNETLEGDFKYDVERSQKDPGYKFVVLNRIVLK